MIYITTRTSPHIHQMTIEELLYGTEEINTYVPSEKNYTSTRTYLLDNVNEESKFRDRFTKVAVLIKHLQRFNKNTEELRGKERQELYNTFRIPKRSGGLRRIDAPNDELMKALRDLKEIFEEDFGALYHTAAFAYIKGRSTIDSVKRHQANQSRWFLKLDLHDFFGSTTLEYVMEIMSMIFPFSEVVRDPIGKQELRKALDLAFLNGGLPQGTPISPLITNIIMIPIDYKLSNMLREFEIAGKKQHFVYTRYADDFLVSSKYDFDMKILQNAIISVLKEFKTPFSLNTKKTRYGSSSGSNWNLGVMLNKDNEITIGYKKKRVFKSMLINYIADKKKGIKWDISDLQVTQGLYSYYHMVEPESIEGIIKFLNQKYSVNVLMMIKEDLR